VTLPATDTAATGDATSSGSGLAPVLVGLAAILAAVLVVTPRRTLAPRRIRRR
jgi:hypothetical protein